MALNQVQQNPSTAPIWQPIIAKYHPTLIGDCQKAIKWSEEIVKEWLVSCMFKDDSDATVKADTIVSELGSHEMTKSHDRHISMSRARDLGIRVTALEEDSQLQEAMLTVHHACIQTISSTPAFKLIENHNGVGFFQQMGSVQVKI